MTYKYTIVRSEASPLPRIIASSKLLLWFFLEGMWEARDLLVRLPSLRDCCGDCSLLKHPSHGRERNRFWWLFLVARKHIYPRPREDDCECQSACSLSIRLCSVDGQSPQTLEVIDYLQSSTLYLANPSPLINPHNFWLYPGAGWNSEKGPRNDWVHPRPFERAKAKAWIRNHQHPNPSRDWKMASTAWTRSCKPQSLKLRLNFESIDTLVFNNQYLNTENNLLQNYWL